MQEDLDPQECQPPFSPKYSQLGLIKMNSYFQDYNESAEMKEIQEDQEKLQQEFFDLEAMLYDDNQFLKKNNFQNQIDALDDPVVPKSSTIVQNSNIDPEQPSLKPKKFQNKSYCRYIMLYVFRTIENKQFAENIRDICSKFQVNYDTFVEYYRQQRILIMGYQALKKELIYENQSLQIQNRKKAFKQVLVWYLDRLATKHILLSKKQNFKEYLKFKNYVMSYYIHNPQSWVGNKPQWN